MFIKNLSRLKEIKVNLYMLSYFFGGWLWKTKLHRWLAGGTWYKYLTFDRGGNHIYFWSRIADMEKNEFGVTILVKTEKYK